MNHVGIGRSKLRMTQPESLVFGRLSHRGQVAFCRAHNRRVLGMAPHHAAVVPGESEKDRKTAKNAMKRARKLNRRGA